ncbi:MAG: M48 family metalloprotease [Elusimicrobia bacterium]|nr:M48 family metalloprotease [Elusimicrobiota bacterium]
MKARAAVLSALCLLAAAGWARAGDDGLGGVFKGALKKGALKGAVEKVKEKVPVSDEKIESVTKTVKAFRKSAEDISESEEHYLGRAVAAQLLATYPPVEDEGLNRYVQSVLQAVAGASSRPEVFSGYHAQVVESDEVNAVSAPGGYVFVTTGLLRIIEDEEELACVLAHEVAHIADRHGLKTIKTSRLTSAFQVLGAEAAKNYSAKDLGKLSELFGGSVDDVVKALVVSGYSRDKEFEADKDGARFARTALYDPGALDRFIGRLEAGGKGGFFKTHPAPKKRLASLAEEPLEPAPGYGGAGLRKKRFAAALAKL